MRSFTNRFFLTIGYKGILTDSHLLIDDRKKGFVNVKHVIVLYANAMECIGETGVHWDTGSIGTPPLVENLQHTEPMRCHFLEAWEPPLYKSIRTKKIMQYKKVGE